MNVVEDTLQEPKELCPSDMTKLLLRIGSLFDQFREDNKKEHQEIKEVLEKHSQAIEVSSKRMTRTERAILTLKITISTASAIFVVVIVPLIGFYAFLVKDNIKSLETKVDKLSQTLSNYNIRVENEKNTSAYSEEKARKLVNDYKENFSLQ